MLIRLERYQEALLACDQALQLDNTYYMASLDKGECLCSLGKYQDARVSPRDAQRDDKSLAE